MNTAGDMGQPVGLRGVDEPEQTDRLLRIPTPEVRGRHQPCKSAVGHMVKMPVDVSFAGNGTILGRADEAGNSQERSWEASTVPLRGAVWTMSHCLLWRVVKS
ncbi:MAG: hypothetical protein EA367_15950 [Leptolyngbya sp. DLM2.Bin15]|nr:MAG: hypothetical protein EA367_15950 [Leptolyngbya sp. DLM2.Bin15]